MVNMATWLARLQVLLTVLTCFNLREMISGTLTAAHEDNIRSRKHKLIASSDHESVGFSSDYHISFETSSRYTIREDGFAVDFFPPEINPMYMNKQKHVYINYTASHEEISMKMSNFVNYNQTANVTFIAVITSDSPDIAFPVIPEMDDKGNLTIDLQLVLKPNQTSSFIVEGACVGYAMLHVHFMAVIGYDETEFLDLKTHPSSDVATLSIIPYRVKVVRRLRRFDFAYDWTIGTIVAMNSLSIGCATDLPSLRMHLKHPTSLVLALGCQVIVMPMISLAIVKSLGLSRELCMGLFYTACVPGGGMGHVMVSMIQGDRALSIAINSAVTFLSIGTFTLWVFGVGRFLSPAVETSQHLLKFVVCLAVCALMHSLGACLRYLVPSACDAFLNWFSKPFLLFYSLMFITIGIYINIYVFTVLHTSTMVAMAMLPALGYLVGMFVAYISRQEEGYVKTISAESTISNCLLVLVMVRFSLEQPESDIASAVSIWIVFVSPAPFIIHGLAKTIKRSIWRRCAKRREKRYRHFSIVSSIINITNVTNLSSSLSPKLLTPESDKSVIDQKITVL